jgi:hypothetical protein
MMNHLNALGLHLFKKSQTPVVERARQAVSYHEVADQDLSEQVLRDIGILDGRVSPSTARHLAGSGFAELIDSLRRSH